MSAPNIETIVSLAKRRGFVFPSSEIYGGLGSAWDYGPLGVELCNNVKQAWWRWMVYERDDMEGLDSSIILNRLVWKYSGHEDTFSDPLVDCRNAIAVFALTSSIVELRQTHTELAELHRLQILERHQVSKLRSRSNRTGVVRSTSCFVLTWARQPKMIRRLSFISDRKLRRASS